MRTPKRKDFKPGLVLYNWLGFWILLQSYHDGTWSSEGMDGKEKTIFESDADLYDIGDDERPDHKPIL